MCKYIKYIFAVAFFAAAFAGCKKDKDPEFRASLAKLEFAASGEGLVKSFDITSNVEWSLSGEPSWLTVTPKSGKGNGKVTATAQENTAASTRQKRFCGWP